MATVKLAKIERERRPEPFTVELTDGSEVTLVDPKKMPFGVLTEFDELKPMDQLRTLCGEDGFKRMKDDPELDAEAFEQVMKLWQDHYGMTDPPSPGSSPGS